MRVWFDHEHCVPVDFDRAADRTGTVHIRVSFVDDNAARAFERSVETAATGHVVASAVGVGPMPTPGW